MSNRIQYRRDTKARWAEVNPVLMEGEVGLETDTKNIKMGDGSTAWNNLEYGVGYSNITSDEGTSDNLAMSQKAVTELVKEIKANFEKRGNLYRYKDVQIKSFGLQGVVSNTGTYYRIALPMYVEYVCKDFSWGRSQVVAAILDENYGIVKEFKRTDTTTTVKFFTEDYDGAYWLRLGNAFVSLNCYFKETTLEPITNYAANVNFGPSRDMIKGYLSNLIGVGSEATYKVSGSQLANLNNGRTFVSLENTGFSFKLSASEVSAMNAETLYLYSKYFLNEQYNNNVQVSDGIKTLSVNTWQYANRSMDFSLSYNYYKIDVSELDKSKSWTITLPNAPHKKIKLLEDLKLFIELWDEERPVEPSANVRGMYGIHDNWSWSPTEECPTILDAIEATSWGGTLCIKRGTYPVEVLNTGNELNDGIYVYKPISIIGDRNVTIEGGKAITSAELYDADKKIYAHDVNTADNGYLYDTAVWILQKGVADEDTAIPKDEVNALTRGKAFRMNACSRIYKVGSLEEVKGAKKPSYYLDATNNKLYFTIKEGSTLEKNPVMLGRNPKDVYKHNNDTNLIIGATHDVLIRNINVAYGKIEIEGCENCIIENCVCYGVPGNGSSGFGISPSSKYVKIINTEIYGNSADGINSGSVNSPIGGNFINTNYKQSQMSRDGINLYIENCWVHDNSDDGISEHGNPNTVVKNNILEYNGISGCTTAGGNSNYIGCIFRKNAWRSTERGGFENLSADANSTCIVKDCVGMDNYGQSDFSVRSNGNESRAIFINCKSIRTEEQIPSWVDGYETINPAGFEIANDKCHMKIIGCSSNREVKLKKLSSSLDVKIYNDEIIK